MVNRKSSSGFTLLEVLMVAGLFSLILGSMLGVFLTGHMAWGTGQGNIDIQQQVSWGMGAMVKELNLTQENKVRIRETATTLDLQVPLDAAADGEDGRSRIDIDAASGDLVWGADGATGDWIEDIVEHDAGLDTNVLRRKVWDRRPWIGHPFLQHQTTLARDIQSVRFVADGPSSTIWPAGVEIILTAAKGNSSYSLTTMVFFKN